MGDLSAHFSRSEFADHRTGQVYVAPELVRALEVLRHEIGDRPITIVSGYRSPSTNKAVGGASNSQHLWGRAADLSDALGVTIEQAKAAGFSGIGVNPRGHVVHVDVRGGRPVVFADAGTG